jgi:hypothetical protein
MFVHILGRIKNWLGVFQLNPAIYILGTAISTFILTVAVQNYRRKSGIGVQGSYTVTSSIDCDDKYVSSIILENLKDRSITIFAIYLQAGRPYHLQLDNFEDAPFILKPFETFYKEYGPIEFYEFNMKKVEMDALFDNKNVRKRLVLSTSQGRYVIRKGLYRWNPIVEYFRNSYAATPRPITSTYKQLLLGSNVKYVVELGFKDGENQVIPICRRDHELQRFRSFRLTPESIANKESLEAFLESMRVEGKLICKSLKVADIDEWRKTHRDDYKEPKIVLTDVGPIRYHVFGRLHSIYTNWKTKRDNRRRTS